MNKRNRPAIFAGLSMLLLILDIKTAIQAVKEGMELCLQVLIPSIFPFLFLSILVTSAISGIQIRILRPLTSRMHIPPGAESIFLMGILGGYPVGAQCISHAVESGSISRETGNRMLSFCNNAGPSFIFGIGSNLFIETWSCWAIWGIQILSAILVSLVIPQNGFQSATTAKPSTTNLTAALRKSIGNISMICGWVILFRIILAFCYRWFLWLFPQWLQLLISGALELANGCCNLILISDPNLRFLLFSGLLGFGGVCVALQTYSICQSVDFTWYLPGKILQTIFGVMLSYMIISREKGISIAFLLAGFLALTLFFKGKHTNNGSIPRKFGV